MSTDANPDLTGDGSPGAQHEGTGSGSGLLDWQFTQSFGDRSPLDEIAEADLITTVTFDPRGDFIATGDRGGRVVLLDRSGGRYMFYTEFQSHENEFDCLKSQDIEEKINVIRWAPRQSAGHFLLTTNDDTIKFWKVYEKRLTEVTSYNLPVPDAEARAAVHPAVPSREMLMRIDASAPPRPSDLVPQSYLDRFSAHRDVLQAAMPTVSTREMVFAAALRRSFCRAHAYHINSLSLSVDGESFLSSDDLRINLWHLEHDETTFNMVDLKPENMEDLAEVITAAEFDPCASSLFGYTTSRGTLHFADLRLSQRITSSTRQLQFPEPAGSSGFFSEIVATPSSLAFSENGHCVATRDYVYVRVWDRRRDDTPLSVLCVHEFLRPKFGELYMRDLIFDRFNVVFSPDSNHLLTGSYHNFLHVFACDGSSVSTVEAVSPPPRVIRRTTPLADSSDEDDEADGAKDGSFASRRHDVIRDLYNPAHINFDQKVLRCDWHPTENIIAVAAAHKLYLFEAP